MIAIYKSKNKNENCCISWNVQFLGQVTGLQETLRQWRRLKRDQVGNGSQTQNIYTSDLFL